MPSSVKPIPDGFHSVTPYLVVEGVPKLITFLEQAFDANEIERIPGPDGAVAHAEVRIGDSIVMMGSPRGETKAMPTTLYLYVTDIDATYTRALAAGGVSISEPTDQFYGDRTGAVRDPGGNEWHIATHVEDVSKEQLTKRMQAFSQGAAAQGGEK